MLDQNHVYEDYQDSGQSWVGEYPSDWKLVRNKAIFTEKTAAVGKRACEYKLLSLTLGGVIPRDMENPKGKFPTEFDTYKIVEPDDLIFCLFDVAETPRAVGRADEAGMITGAYTVLRPRPGISPRFLNYFYLSLDYDKRLSPLYTGLRNVIKIDTFMSIKTPLPDLDTQNRIVSFLDEKTAEIDAAVAKKRRLIDLLNEQKGILINRAVTKGLNPDAPMKDSGVDWIGEIPVHWEVKRFKHCVKTQSGQVDPTKQPYKEMILIAPNHIVQGTGETLDFETADEQGADSGKYFAEAGSVIYSKIRPNLNKACIVDFDALCSADMYALRGYPKYFEQQYLLRQILSNCFVIPAVDASMRVAMPKVNREAMAEFPMIIPPKSEQSEIIEWLDMRLAEVRAPQIATEREISTLNEFKQTLIANAVTGKIKI